MSDDVLVRVEGVSKKFCRSLKKSLLYGMQDLGNELRGRRHGGDGELRPDEFWAVKDVSFELKRGECLGLIGRNGAGKTTLLRMLNGLIKPDAGRIEMRGRVGALIALGAGFNPILSGRENIYVNASVLGITMREIEEKVDEIIEFAEIGEFIDMPVKSYSSGMQVRLGFSVAAHLSPNVLIIDEVLAVGDVGFRAKCYNRINAILDRTAVIFVSHMMSHVARIAQRALVMDHGRALSLTRTPNALVEYYRLFKQEVEAQRSGTGEARIDAVAVLDGSGRPTREFSYGQTMMLRLQISTQAPLKGLVFDIAFRTAGDELVAECNNFVRSRPLRLQQGGRARLEVVIDSLLLNPGVYRLAYLLTSADMAAHYDWIRGTDTVTVVDGRPATAALQFDARWRLESAEAGRLQ